MRFWKRYGDVLVALGLFLPLAGAVIHGTSRPGTFNAFAIVVILLILAAFAGVHAGLRLAWSVHHNHVVSAREMGWWRAHGCWVQPHKRFGMLTGYEVREDPHSDHPAVRVRRRVRGKVSIGMRAKRSEVAFADLVRRFAVEEPGYPR